MDAEFLKLGGKDYSIIVIILYGIYAEVKSFLKSKKDNKKIEEAKNVTVSCRTSDLQNIHRRLKLVELEDHQHAIKTAEYKEDETNETRNFINGFVLTLEVELQRRVKDKLKEDNAIMTCPKLEADCAISSKIIGANISSYNNALGKVAKGLKDYIWSVILINGFYELTDNQLEKYVEGKGTILWHKVGDEMEAEMPKGFAIEYDRNRISKTEAIKFAKDLIDNIIEIKTRFEKKRRKSLKLHKEILEKIYSDDDEE
jgi:hypothetical protein